MEPGVAALSLPDDSPLQRTLEVDYIKCCLPTFPCGDIVCTLVSSVEACLAAANAASPLQVDSLLCAREAQRLPKWEDVVLPFVQLPVLAFAFCFLVFAVLGAIYSECGLRQLRLLTDYVGTIDHPLPVLPNFLRLVNGLQLALSSMLTLMFIITSYARTVPPEIRDVEWIAGVFFIFHFLVRGVSSEFRLWSLFTVMSIVDVLTIPSMLLPKAAHKSSWLSLHFLRTLHVFGAYEQISSYGSDDSTRRGLISMILRFVVLVSCFAGAILVLEVLGEIPALDHLELSTDMGDISFFTMVYWIVETITTVGYGDYHPTTWLARVVTACLMVTGFAFLGLEMERIFSIMARNKKFAGSYIKTSRSHVVLVGGGVQQTDELLLLAFTEELFHPSYHRQWPDLLIMAADAASVERAKDILDQQLQWQARQQVYYLAGSPLNEQDLMRSRCDCAAMVCVISDTTGKKDPADEDKETLMRALSVRHTVPQTPLRVMLLLQASRETATGIGIPPRFCFAMNEMKDSLFWQSCRCKGWNTLLCNLMVTTGDEEVSPDNLAASPWLEEYVCGMGYEVYGILPKPEYAGMTLRFIMLEAYRRNGVLIMAVQIRGRIRPAPLSSTFYIKQDTVLFCLAQDESDLATLAVDTEILDWRKVFEQNRRIIDESASSDRFRDRAASLRTPEHGFGTGSQPGIQRKDSVDLSKAEQEADGSFASNSGSVDSWTGDHRPKKTTPQFDPADSPLAKHEKGHLPMIGELDAEQNEEGSVFTSEHQPLLTEIGIPSGIPQSEAETNVSANEDEGLRLLRLLAKSARKIIKKATEAPFVLLIDQSKSWSSVLPFLMQSRVDYMPFVMPLVVLSELPPPDAIATRLASHEEGLIGSILGSSTRRSDLLAAGVRQCSIIVCVGQDFALTAQPSREMVAMLDADVLMLHRMLSSLGVGNKAMIFEFRRTLNMRLLPQVERRRARRSTHDTDVVDPDQRSSQLFFRDSLVDDDRAAGSSTPARGMWQFLASCCNWCSKQPDAIPLAVSRESNESLEIPTTPVRLSGGRGVIQREDTPWYLDPRFAAGEVCSSHFLGALLAHAFYTPGVLEVMQALLIPSDDEESLPWQIHLRRHQSELTYGEVFAELVQDGQHPVLPIGLLRSSTGTNKPYVVTNPKSDTRLRENDLLFVLGDRRFGHAAYQEGLLPLSGKNGRGSPKARWSLAWDGSNAPTDPESTPPRQRRHMR